MVSKKVAKRNKEEERLQMEAIFKEKFPLVPESIILEDYRSSYKDNILFKRLLGLS